MRRNHLVAIMISSFLLIVITTLVLSCAGAGHRGTAGEGTGGGGAAVTEPAVPGPPAAEIKAPFPERLPLTAHLP